MLWIAVLGAAAFVGFVLLRDDARGAAHDSTAARLPVPADTTRALEPLSAETSPAVRESVDTPATSPATSVPITVAAPAEVELRGTIVAIDEKGAEHAQENGEFVLIAWTRQRGTEATVAVRAGRWTARVPAGVLLGCGSAKLGGRDAVLERELDGTPSQLPLPADGTLELRMRWLRALRLFVRDRDSNVDLAEVTLVRAGSWPRSDNPHPGEITAERLFANARPSPIEIAAQNARYLPLHVGSPGHAWETVRLDCAEGGERFVVLGPGGDLDLDLVAERIDASSVVRVRGPIGIVAAEFDIHDRRRFAIDGLPVGKLPVSVEIGDWWEQPIVLGKDEVEIRAGERAHLVLALAAPPADKSVKLGGTVVLPTEWGLERFMLVVELLDPPLNGREPIQRIQSKAMSKDAERAGVWHWHLEGMQPGRYQLLLWQLQFVIALRLEDGGREDVVITAPPPCEARVRVVDRLAGTEAEVEHVYWNGKRTEWAPGGGSLPAEWNADDRAWHLRAPRGEIELHTSDARYKQIQRIVELRSGTNDIVLEVERQFGVVLTLARAGSAVPWPQVVGIKLREKTGGKEQSRWSGGGPQLFVAVDHPGEWIVTLPEIAGYELVPPVELRVDPERVSEQTIELVPKR